MEHVKCPHCKQEWEAEDAYDSLMSHTDIFHPFLFNLDEEEDF